MDYVQLQRFSLNLRFLGELDSALYNSVSGRYHNKRLAGAVEIDQMERRRRLTANGMYRLDFDSGLYEAKSAKEAENAHCNITTVIFER